MNDNDIAETHAGTTTPIDSILTPYRGTPVVAAGVAIANASGGLHEAVAVDPVELEIGSTVHVVLRCVVRPPQYDPVDKDNLRGPLKLVNRLHADSATFVDEQVVKEHLDAQRERIAQAKSIEEERARVEAGELPLPFDDEGGDPQSVGSILDDALDLADGAEHEGAERTRRAAELEAMTKAELADLARESSVNVGKLTKPELVEAILEAEQVPF